MKFCAVFIPNYSFPVFSYLLPRRLRKDEEQHFFLFSLLIGSSSTSSQMEKSVNWNHRASHPLSGDLEEKRAVLAFRGSWLRFLQELERKGVAVSVMRDYVLQG